MKVKTNSLLYCFLYFFVGTVCNIIPCLSNSYALKNLELIGWFSAINLFSFLFINATTHKKAVNFNAVFAVILYVFHFGQLVLYTFFRNIYSHIRFLILLDAKDALYGFKCMHIVFTAICFGMLLATSKVSDGLITVKANYYNTSYDFESIAKKIIAFTFPVKLFIDMMCVIYCLKEGGVYARRWINQFPNVLLYYGKIALVGFALLLIIYKDSPLKQKRLFLFIELYILIMMVSGIRSENVGYFCVFALLYFLSKKTRTKIISLILIGSALFFILAFIIAVGEFRLLSDRSFESFCDLYVDCLTEKNVIFSLLDTCGDTGYTAQCVINKWLPKYGPSYGSSYYLGLFAIIPNIPPLITFPGSITASSSFPLRLQGAGTLSSNYLNIGGSLIGELFFNFGIIGAAIFAVFTGIWIGNVSYKCISYINKNNYYGLLLTVPTMMFMIYWVRDYFGGEFRIVVWGVLIPLVIIKLFANKIKSEKQFL